VDWQTTRIEANAREDENSLPSTPLRLIANQSKIRIVLKKRISGEWLLLLSERERKIKNLFSSCLMQKMIKIGKLY